MGRPSAPKLPTAPSSAQIEAEAEQKRLKTRNAAYDYLASLNEKGSDQFLTGGLGLFTPGTGYPVNGEPQADTTGIKDPAKEAAKTGNAQGFSGSANPYKTW